MIGGTVAFVAPEQTIDIIDNSSGPVLVSREPNANNGYILLHRSLRDHPLADSQPAAWFRVWVLILLMVNWKPKLWFDGHRQVYIPAGSMITSLRNLSRRTGSTIKEIRGAIQYLLAARSIVVETAHNWTKITVLNWDTYQSSGRIKGTMGDTRGGTQRALTKEGRTRKRRTLPHRVPIRTLRKHGSTRSSGRGTGARWGNLLR
jgi:hypothetical protein